MWIGVQLLSEHGDDEGEEKQYGSMMAAIRTILIADLVMSLDNVIAVAAAANGNMVLLVLGLAISIPMVIFGSTLMIRLMERFPVVVTFWRWLDRLGGWRDHGQRQSAGTASGKHALAAPSGSSPRRGAGAAARALAAKAP